MNTVQFSALPLAAPLQHALSEKGYTHPSPIQAQAIPVLLEGRDLLACAQTGTGKTAAFSLPILNRISETRGKPGSNRVRTLVLTPTRELAIQVADSFRAYGKNIRFTVGLVYGGVSQHAQVRSLQRGLDVLVATPGRLLDLFGQGHIDFSGVDCLVLDEADRMLDMGFIHDIRRIVAELPTKRQTMLFSATMGAEVTKLAASLLVDPEEIRIAPKVTTAENIDQRILFVQQQHKQSLLLGMLGRRQRETSGELNLVFSRTKHGAQKLANQLKRAGIDADAIHGDKSQAARQRTLDKFRQGRTSVLVATDVAARGIDVHNITLVVNYDLPMEPDSYVHRIGRTARAGNSGRAVSFCTDSELNLLRSVEKLIKRTVPVDSGHEHHCEVTAERHRSGKGGGQGKGGYGKSNGRFQRNRPNRGESKFRGKRTFAKRRA